MKMADSVLPLLEFFDDSEVEYDEIFRLRFSFHSVVSSYIGRNLNRVYEHFESTISLYFPDEFKSISNDKRTCELFTHEVMQTGRILKIAVQPDSNKTDELSAIKRQEEHWNCPVSRKGQIEQKFPVISIFQNIGTT